MASTTTLRHLRVCPIERTSLTTSYLGATSSNIVATSSGRLSKDARFTLTIYSKSLQVTVSGQQRRAGTGSCRQLRVLLTHHDQHPPHPDSPFGWRFGSRG